MDVGVTDPCISVDCKVAIGEKCVLVPSLGLDLNDSGLPQCTCSYPCPVKVDPVCASNGHQYENECIMEKHMCHKNMTLSVVYYGQCNGTNFKQDSFSRNLHLIV